MQRRAIGLRNAGSQAPGGKHASPTDARGDASVPKAHHLLWLLAAMMLLTACASTIDYQSSAGSWGGGSPVYTIREGESLYTIAWRYGLDYKEVASWNNIGPPYT